MTNLEEYNEGNPNSAYHFLKASPGGKLILLAVLALVGSILLSLFTLIIGKLSGTDMTLLVQGQIESTDKNAWYVLRILLVFNSIMVFIIPAYIYNYIVDRNYLNQYGIEEPKNINYWPWAFMLFTVAMPLVIASAWANQQIDLPTWAQQSEENINGIIESLLKNSSVPSFVFNIVVMAFLPAVGEEWFFRASLQRLLSSWFKKEWIAIIFTGFIFSLLHFQFEGFLPRFILGMILGLIFSKTKNIWVCILLHFLFNAIQITTAFFNTDKLSNLNKEQIPTPNWWIVSLCSIILIYLISSSSKPNTEVNEY